MRRAGSTNRLTHLRAKDGKEKAMPCCERDCKTKAEMRITHGDPQEFWEALLCANTDGFITMDEARDGQEKYEAIYVAAPEGEPTGEEP
jgi:hypothetical protein